MDRAREDRERSYQTEVADLGVPTISLERALQLAGDLEDEEIIRKMHQGVQRSTSGD